MKERKIRVGPWDCRQSVLDRVTLYRARLGGASWTYVLHKALEELLDREQIFLDAPALNVERPQNLESVAISSPVAPAAVVPAFELSPNAQRLINLRAGLARKRATLAAAYEELKTDPASLRANNLIKRLPADIEDSERLILEVGALVEAAKENTGGVEPGAEV